MSSQAPIFYNPMRIPHISLARFPRYSHGAQENIAIQRGNLSCLLKNGRNYCCRIHQGITCCIRIANVRRFQADTDFVVVSFDLMRREKVLTDVNIRATRTTWERTRYLLESITPHEFEHAIRLQQHHQPIQNPAINQLLKLLGQIGMASPGSDDKKSYMLTELKSSVVFYGMPVIYLTINPVDRNSPLPLLH